MPAVGAAWLNVVICTVTPVRFKSSCAPACSSSPPALRPCTKKTLTALVHLHWFVCIYSFALVHLGSFALVHLHWVIWVHLHLFMCIGSSALDHLHCFSCIGSFGFICICSFALVHLHWFICICSFALLHLHCFICIGSFGFICIGSFGFICICSFAFVICSEGQSCIHCKAHAYVTGLQGTRNLSTPPTRAISLKSHKSSNGHFLHVKHDP